MYFANPCPKVGDKIAVPRLKGIAPFYGHFDHVAIYVGPAGPLGEDVVENDMNGGVRLIHLADFARGQSIRIQSPAPKNWIQQEEIKQRALDLLGQKYDLFFFNCEHLANYAQTGKAFSPQLQGVIAVLLFVGAAAILLGAAGRR